MFDMGGGGGVNILSVIYVQGGGSNARLGGRELRLLWL